MLIKKVIELALCLEYCITFAVRQNNILNKVNHLDTKH